MYVYFISIEFIFNALLIESNAATSQHIRSGKRLNNNSLDIVTGISFISCVEECLIRKRCLTVNYQRIFTWCDLNFNIGIPFNAPQDKVKLLEDDRTSDFTDMKSWNKAMVGPCSSYPCADNQKCVRKPFGKYECKISDCGILAENPNTIDITKNTEHVRIGVASRRRFRCQNGFGPVGSTADIYCFPDGNWTQPLFFCSRLPVIELRQQYVGEIGSAVTLQATILSETHVRAVSWFKLQNGESIPVNNERYANEIPSSSSLVLSHFEAKDYGSYAIEVTNDAGSNTETTVVIVDEEFHWIDGSLYTFSNWKNGQTSNRNQDCVIMRETGQWDDKDCTKPFHYICYATFESGLCVNSTNNYSNKCYHIQSTDENTWKEAQSACKARGMNLVRFTSSSEVDHLIHHIEKSKRKNKFWIGLKRKKYTV